MKPFSVRCLRPSQIGIPVAMYFWQDSNWELEMKVTQNQLVLVPVALILGGALFAFGHSLRPKPTEIRSPEVNIVRTSGAGSMDSRDVVTANLASVAAIPAPQEVAAAGQLPVRSGVIVSMNGELFILRDDENDTWYHLDDQKAAGSFLGKKVRVTGEVDPATDVIHVESIQEAKA
jgi:hypothetical protein